MMILDPQIIENFRRDGFVVIPNALGDEQISRARARFPLLFRGEFETNLQPDEWNWREGRDAPELTRQICNAWKSDRTIASIVLHRDVGEACAVLRGWPGARINQDNVIWKPPGAQALGFHQDDSYQNWIQPNEMMSCWFTLDDTKAHQGTIGYVRGSHRWPLAPPIAQFHAPDDPLWEMKQAAELAGMEPEIVPIEVAAGSVVIHHGRTWHGSKRNCGSGERRAVVAHCMSSEAVFHPQNTNPIYSRYHRRGSLQMDESFFPILWDQSRPRTAWLDAYVSPRRTEAEART